MKWIDVKDKMPESNKTVMICLDDGNKKATDVGYFSEHAGCWKSVNDNWKFIFSVTHWMPLPEPPQLPPNK